MSSELCKSCAHHKVCAYDKNLIGDVFVMGPPMLYDNRKLYENFKKWEADGFPCEDYMEMPTDVTVIRCKDCKYWFDAPVSSDYNSCEKDALIRHKDFFCAYGERRTES